MTANPNHRHHAAKPIFTMRMALEKYRVCEEIEPRRRIAVIADVERAFKLEPALADLPASGRDIKWLLRKFANSKGQLNMRSSIRALLKWRHEALPNVKIHAALNTAWKALLDHKDIPRLKWFSLCRFARYCQSRKITPQDVSDQVLAEFYDLLLEIGTLKDPRQHLRMLINGWNQWLVLKALSPLKMLTLPSLDKGPQRTPALEDMDADQASEITKCMEFMAANEVKESAKRQRFDRRNASQGGPSPTRKKLKVSTIVSYGKYLRRSVRTLGEDPDRKGRPVSLRETVEPANVEFIMNKMLEELEEGNKGERSLHLMGCALTYIAKHYYKVSPEDLEEIKNLCDQVARPEPKMTVKNIERLRCLVIEKRRELMRLPARLLNPVLKKIKAGRCSPKDLTDAQVAVAIAVLPIIPIREKNLAEIRLGIHLTLPKQPGTPGRLQMPGSLIKNGIDLDRTIPVDVAELLRAYVEHVLPLIRSNPESNALFPGRADNSTRGPAFLGTQVSRRIQAHMGIEMNLHLFRHFVAMVYLEEHPGEYEVVRLLLGNRNLDIVKAYYTGIEQQAAYNKANAVIAKTKAAAGLSPRNMLKTVDEPRRGKKAP